MNEQQQAAMRQALEAICGSGDFLFNWHDCEPNNEREMQAYQAALAANEKAFIALRRALQSGTDVEQQPADEPVAWINEDQTIGPEYGKKHYSEKPYYSLNPLRYKHTPLYTRPQPAAQWVGLTDDAIYAAAEVAWRAGWSACRDAEFVGEEAEDEAWGYQGATVAQDTEAKLREKDNGNLC